MSIETPPIPEPAPDSDWARPLIERQLALLGRLAEAGLEIALAVERQATGQQAQDEAPVAADVSLAYARVSRAVRLTVALQSKRIEALQALESGAVSARDEAQDIARRLTPEYGRKARVERIVERVIKTEYEKADAEEIEETLDRMLIEAGERLDDEDQYGDVLDRPLSELVADICRDLGLKPDWSVLSQEPWAVAELESGEIGAPLSKLEPAFPLDAARPPPQIRSSRRMPGPRSYG